MADYYVEIVDRATNAIERRLGPYSLATKAERVRDGIAINLNVDKFEVRYVLAAREAGQ